ncbi:MAG: hypothetical protein QG589_409 [Patescibacteria group bacterium]|nr:hypothetical protein [Patescibacteria group bacterium]
MLPRGLQDILSSTRENPSDKRNQFFLREAKLFEQRVFHYTTDGEVFFEQDEYLPYTEALEKASQIQPVDYNRFNPTGGLNQELFDCVRHFLPDVMRSSLELIITIGTEFDYFHGGDAVFRLSYGGNTVVVSLDATINDNKIKMFERRQFLRLMSFKEKTRKRMSELSRLEKEVKTDFMVWPREVDSGRFLSRIPIQIALLLLSRLMDQIGGGCERVSFCRAVSL